MKTNETDKSLGVCLMNDSFAPFIDGVNTVMINYAEIIKEKYGYPVVVTPNNSKKIDSSFDFPIVRYPAINIEKLTMGYRAGMPFSKKMFRDLEKHPIDVIHTHCPIASAACARVIQSRRPAPLICTYHSRFDHELDTLQVVKLVGKQGKKFILQNVLACDEVWVVSKGAEKSLRNIGYEGDCTLMHNGCDLSRKRAEDDAVKHATRLYDLPENTPVLLSVGRLLWNEKNLKLALDSLIELHKHNVDFRAVFIGSGSDENAIRKYVEDAGLFHKVIFVGSVNDREIMRAWYTKANLFLFPSTVDTDGLVVREAAACSVPSLLVKGSDASASIKDCHNGYLAEDFAPAFAAKISRILKHPDAAQIVGKNAANELYLSWEDSVKKAVEGYQVAIEKHKSGLYLPSRTKFQKFLETTGKVFDTI